MRGKSVLVPPTPVGKPQVFTLHGHKRADEFTWLQEPSEAREYLKTENSYAEKVMRPTLRLQAKLYKEIRSRIKEDDKSVPIKRGPYLYYTRMKRGKEYAIHCRMKGARGTEEVILDENKLAEGFEYFSLGESALSPDHALLAYTIDTKGDEDHTLFIKDLSTGELRADIITSVGDVEWSEDGLYLFYTKE